MNLLLSLRSEILKTKRTAAFYFAMIGASIMPVIFLFNAISEGLPAEDESAKDPLNAIFGLSTQLIGLGLLPLFVILVCTLLPQIEYRNNTWKQVLTSPQSKATVYLSKFLSMHLMILLFLVAGHVFMWIVIVAIHFILPELDVPSSPLDGYKIFLNTANNYLTVLGVASIQFWLGLRFRSFLPPVAIGLGLWLMGTVMALEYHSSYSPYFPYSFQAFCFAPEYRAQLPQVVGTSIGYAIGIALLGFLDFRRRRMNA